MTFHLKSLLILIGILLLFSSCQTREYEKLPHVPKSHKIYSIAQAMENQCQNSQNPGFSAWISNINWPSSIRMEVSWKKGFQELAGAITSLSGEDIATFRSQNGSVKFHFSEPFHNARGIRELEKILNPPLLRDLVCGTYAFSKPAVFYQLQSGHVESHRALKVQGHDIEIFSQLFLSKIPDLSRKNQQALTIHSVARAETFWKTPHVDIYWQGTLTQKVVQPSNITFRMETENQIAITLQEVE